MHSEGRGWAGCNFFSMATVSQTRIEAFIGPPPEERNLIREGSSGLWFTVMDIGHSLDGMGYQQWRPLMVRELAIDTGGRRDKL